MVEGVGEWGGGYGEEDKGFGNKENERTKGRNVFCEGNGIKSRYSTFFFLHPALGTNCQNINLISKIQCQLLRERERD